MKDQILLEVEELEERIEVLYGELYAKRAAAVIDDER